MSNRFEGRGNLGEKPEWKQVKLDDGKTRDLCAMRIYFDRQVPDGEEYSDKGGFWMNCTLWGERAKGAAEVLGKGARVFVQGTLIAEAWTDSEEAKHEGFKLDVGYLAHDLSRVAGVTLAKKVATERAA
jgi:single-stranded DNA-binding protein